MAKSSHQTSRVRLILVAAIFILVALAYVTYSRLTLPLAPGSSARILVTIPKGASAHEIGAILARRGVLRSGRAFVLAVRLDRAHSTLKPGVYELSPAMSPREVLSAIESGKVVMASITFPEGWTIRQMADLLAKRGMVDRAQFLQLCREDGRSITAPYGFVAPDNNLEGYLFPSTYRFAPHSDARTVASEMLGEFERRVVREHPEVPDWHDAMIVASLVEREAKVEDDRPMIAGVIGNRMRAGMRLQIDATLEYDLPVHKTRLTYADIRRPSPYNTYMHDGLPPTPICCPGLPSIEAALAPLPSDYFYYVAGPGGKHIFSRSMLEHDEVRSKLRDGDAGSAE